MTSVIVFPTSTVSFVLTPVLCHGSFNLSEVILGFHHVTQGGESNSSSTDLMQRGSGNYLREVVVQEGHVHPSFSVLFYCSSN